MNYKIKNKNDIFWQTTFFFVFMISAYVSLNLFENEKKGFSEYENIELFKNNVAPILAENNISVFTVGHNIIIDKPEQIEFTGIYNEPVFKVTYFESDNLLYSSKKNMNGNLKTNKNITIITAYDEVEDIHYLKKIRAFDLKGDAYDDVFKRNVIVRNQDSFKAGEAESRNESFYMLDFDIKNVDETNNIFTYNNNQFKSTDEINKHANNVIFNKIIFFVFSIFMFFINFLTFNGTRVYSHYINNMKINFISLRLFFKKTNKHKINLNTIKEIEIAKIKLKHIKNSKVKEKIKNKIVNI